MNRDQFNHRFFQFIGDVQKTAYGMTKAFQPEGLSKLQFTVLEQLYYDENQSIRQLSEQLLFSQGTIRKAMKLLIEKGFVKRFRDPLDGRKHLHQITRKGKGKLDEIFFQIVKHVKTEYQTLTDEQIKNLIECMDYMTNVLELA